MGEPTVVNFMTVHGYDDASRWLHIDEVRAMTSLSRATIYRLIKRNGFPAGRQFAGTRRRAWRVGDVRTWLDQNLTPA